MKEAPNRRKAGSRCREKRRWKQELGEGAEEKGEKKLVLDKMP